MSTNQPDGILRGSGGELLNLSVVGPEDALGGEVTIYSDDDPVAGVTVVDALLAAKRLRDAEMLSLSG